MHIHVFNGILYNYVFYLNQISIKYWVNFGVYINLYYLSILKFQRYSPCFSPPNLGILNIDLQTRDLLKASLALNNILLGKAPRKNEYVSLWCTSHWEDEIFDYLSRHIALNLLSKYVVDRNVIIYFFLEKNAFIKNNIASKILIKKNKKNRFAILDLRDFKLKKPIANFRNLLYLKLILRRNDYWIKTKIVF